MSWTDEDATKRKPPAGHERSRSEISLCRCSLPHSFGHVKQHCIPPTSRLKVRSVGWCWRLKLFRLRSVVFLRRLYRTVRWNKIREALVTFRITSNELTIRDLRRRSYGSVQCSGNLRTA